MSPHLEAKGPVAVIYLTGRLDDAETRKLQKSLASLNLAELEQVIFDFSNVTSITSSAIGALIAFHKQAARYGVRSRLQAVPPQIHSMLLAVKLDTLIPISSQA